MAQSDLPALAVEALRRALAEAVADIDPAAMVAVSSPWRAPENGLFLHLYDLEPWRDPAPKPQAPLRPAPSWRLRLLAGAFGPSDLAIHRLIGATTAQLLAQPVIAPEQLQAAAVALGLAPEAAARRAHVRLQPLDIAAMTALWQRFAPMRYSLSLGVEISIP
ncbi:MULTISPECIES: Pvc16 family protein [unclassified Xanthobacter]|uniref:Pvc16 family protein n=1 Tax=unclassified Xanthobacter TaxID=2623496 RepID=UPI001EDDD09E|nr:MULTISPECIES: Pvc16 family protein [unclassified Xanthobacter]